MAEASPWLLTAYRLWRMHRTLDEISQLLAAEGWAVPHDQLAAALSDHAHHQLRRPPGR